MLKKIKEKWRQNRLQKESKQASLSPELKKWGYEILFEQLLFAMDPDNYDIREENGKYSVWYREMSEDGSEAWKRRYTKPRLFDNHEDAVKTVKDIIEKANTDFGDTQKRLEDL